MHAPERKPGTKVGMVGEPKRDDPPRPVKAARGRRTQSKHVVPHPPPSSMTLKIMFPRVLLGLLPLLRPPLVGWQGRGPGKVSLPLHAVDLVVSVRRRRLSGPPMFNVPSREWLRLRCPAPQTLYKRMSGRWTSITCMLSMQRYPSLVRRMASFSPRLTLVVPSAAVYINPC